MRRWIVSFFGTGLFPFAPGTVASFAATVLLGAIFYLLDLRRSHVVWPAVLVGLMLAASAGCVILGPWAAQTFGKKDPRQMVLDEVAGICVANLFLPFKVGVHSQAFVLLAAFVAFRIFDVLKPPPCRRLEKLPDGWGILVDDLMAGVYANLSCQIFFAAWVYLLLHGERQL